MVTLQNPKDLTKSYSIEYKDHSIWIYQEGGEGGEFNLQAFYDVVNKFYEDNF